VDGAKQRIFNGNRGVVELSRGERAEDSREVGKRHQFDRAGQHLAGGHFAERSSLALKSHPQTL